jgi:hypothetical protein
MWCWCANKGLWEQVSDTHTHTHAHIRTHTQTCKLRKINLRSNLAALETLQRPRAFMLVFVAMYRSASHHAPQAPVFLRGVTMV